jgi:hypothetical protein
MNITFQKIKPTLYLFAWILLIAVIWDLWLSGLYYLLLIGDYVFVIIFGIFVGIISGFSPKRAYLACFCGFFIIAPSGLFFSIFEDLVFLGILCGVFGIAGAVMRRIITHQKIEELYLTPWDWVLLIGGVSILADYIVIPCAYAELFIYHRLTIFSKFFICSLIGLLALGVYAGVFYCRDYKRLMKSVGKAALGGHGVFLIYRCYLLAVGHTTLESFLLVSLTIVFLVVVLIGTRIGYSRRGNFSDLEQPT